MPGLRIGWLGDIFESEVMGVKCTVDGRRSEGGMIVRFAGSG